MNIIFNQPTKTFYLNTKTTQYVFFINEANIPEHLYYGEKIGELDLTYLAKRQLCNFTLYDDKIAKEYSSDIISAEFPISNTGDLRPCSLDIINGNGEYGIKLHYVSHRIIKGREQVKDLPFSRGNNCETLVITLESEDKINIDLHYIIYYDEDVISRYAVCSNNSQNTIHITKLAMSLDLVGKDYNLIELRGAYHFERGVVETNPIRYGLQTISSIKGASGHDVNPFFALCSKNADETGGEVYGFNLLYSGNFDNEIFVDRFDSTRILSGISSFQFDWVLNKGEFYCSPESVMTYSNCGLGNMSRNFHDFVRNQVIPPDFAFNHRPVVVNTWESFGFDVSERKMLEIIDNSKAIGAELVVLDDGWFRNNDSERLGDWTALKEKFPNGLNFVSKKLKENGLKFGLWFEPEMININSDLYRNHPEWVLGSKFHSTTSRNQLVLDMGNELVVDYLFESIKKCLSDTAIDYLKWDMNRNFSEIGSPACKNQGMIFHKYVLGVYKLLSRLSKQFPKLLIETCSGGGGRFDLGMLFYSPQIWTSDNTDPFNRLDIQLGTSLAYPCSTMSCHLTNARCSGLYPSDDFRFVTAVMGAYGYELDPNALGEERIKKLKEYTELSKKYEDIMLRGDFYRIINHKNNSYASYLQVSKDKKECLMTFVSFFHNATDLSFLIKLNGLNSNFNYLCSFDKKVYNGSVLMKAGIKLLFLDITSGYTKLIKFTRVQDNF